LRHTRRWCAARLLAPRGPECLQERSEQQPRLSTPWHGRPGSRRSVGRSAYQLGAYRGAVLASVRVAACIERATRRAQAALRSAAALSEGAPLGLAGSPSGAPAQRARRALTARKRLRQWSEGAAPGEACAEAATPRAAGAGAGGAPFGARGPASGASDSLHASAASAATAPGLGGPEPPGDALARLGALAAADPAADALLLHLPPGWRREAVSCVVAAPPAMEDTAGEPAGAPPPAGGPAPGAAGLWLRCEGAFVCPATGQRFGTGAEALAHARAARAKPGAGRDAGAAGSPRAGEAAPAPAALAAPPPPKFLPGPAFRRTLSGSVLVSQGSARTDAALPDLGAGAGGRGAAGAAGSEGDSDEARIGALLTLAAASELAADEERRAWPAHAPAAPGAGSAGVGGERAQAAGEGRDARAEAGVGLDEQPELRMVGSVTDIVALPAALLRAAGAKAWRLEALHPDPPAAGGAAGAPRPGAEGWQPGAAMLAAGAPPFTGFGDAVAAAGAARLGGGEGGPPVALERAATDPAGPAAAADPVSAASPPAAPRLPRGLFKTRSAPAQHLAALADIAHGCPLVPDVPQAGAALAASAAPAPALKLGPAGGAVGADAAVLGSLQALCTQAAVAVEAASGQAAAAAQGSQAPAPGQRLGAGGDAAASCEAAAVAGRQGAQDGGAGLPGALARAGGGWAPERPLGRAISDPSVLREGLAGWWRDGHTDGGLHRLPASTSLVSWQARSPHALRRDAALGLRRCSGPAAPLLCLEDGCQLRTSCRVRRHTGCAW